MPARATPLVNGEYYHICNRGVAHQPTYSVKKDYERFLNTLVYYRFNNLPFKFSHLLQVQQSEREKVLSNLVVVNDKAIDLIAYCLMPNHFHLLLQQITEGGISKFMKQLADSYTRYFNTKFDRIGPLFQGAFKAVRIQTEEQLIHVSRYIHLNPLVSFVVTEKDFLSYPWSSLQYYLGDSNRIGIVNTNQILAHFPNSQKYLEFILDQADYGKQLEKIKHLTLEK